MTDRFPTNISHRVELSGTLGANEISDLMPLSIFPERLFELHGSGLGAGQSTSVMIEGSNSGEIWFVCSDADGNRMEFTRNQLPAFGAVREAFKWLRVRVVGGNEETSVSFFVVAP